MAIPLILKIKAFTVRLLLFIILPCTLIAFTTFPTGSDAKPGSPLLRQHIQQSPLLQDQAAMVPPTPPNSPLSPLPVSPLNTPTPTLEAFTPTPIPTSTPIPTPTIVPTPMIIDQAQGLSKEATFTVMVERVDGRRQIYFVPVAEVPLTQGDAGRNAYETYRQSLLRLLPGDRVVYECAAPSVLSVPEEYRCFGRKRVTLNTPP